MNKTLRNWGQNISPKMFARLMSFWPPYLGAGIRVEYVSDDWRIIKVSMKLSSRNKNYVGTHFGGSLYAMVDPFYMLMLMRSLGNDYIVWDKAASINFKKPGKGKVTAQFQLNQSDIDEIKEQVDKKSKLVIDRFVEVKDEQGIVVSEIDKKIYIRKK